MILLLQKKEKCHFNNPRIMETQIRHISIRLQPIQLQTESQEKSFQISLALAERELLRSNCKGFNVLKYPEIFPPLQCKKIRIGAIKIWVLKTFGRLYLNQWSYRIRPRLRVSTHSREIEKDYFSVWDSILSDSDCIFSLTPRYL